MLRHIHPKVVLRRDGASRTRIPPVLETGSLAAGSSLCIRKPPVRFPCERLLAGTDSFLSRSLRHPQNARRSQGRGYAGIPFVSLVTDCPEFHGCSFQLACCLLSRVPVGDGYRNGIFRARAPARQTERWRLRLVTAGRCLKISGGWAVSRYMNAWNTTLTGGPPGAMASAADTPAALLSTTLTWTL